uniref:Zinc finger PHD-type domain-containing protein n=1 Tax=Tetranychus urticae TaxID=32264 RepID=T1JV73_TETUR
MRNKSSKEVLNNSPPTLYEDTPIDPDEPTYCSCEQVSYGEMICCDNTHCPIEWFHFACVALTTKPKVNKFSTNTKLSSKAK